MAKLEDFTEKQLDLALKETMKRLLVNPFLVQHEKTPQAFLLGGQSGAGKTTLHQVLISELGGNAIVINGDEYRHSHPNFKRIQARYGVDAPTHMAKWAGQMTEVLIDTFSQQGYNLIIEGTLRTSNVPLRTATLLRERGYAVSLAVMAVKPEISLVSCQIRYEMMRLAGTTPRATDPSHHDKIVHEIADNLSVLEESGAFDSVRLFSRTAACLYPANDASSAADVMRSVLFGNWTEEERVHYAFLQRKLEELRTQSELSSGDSS